MKNSNFVFFPYHGPEVIDFIHSKLCPEDMTIDLQVEYIKNILSHYVDNELLVIGVGEDLDKDFGFKQIETYDDNESLLIKLGISWQREGIRAIVNELNVEAHCFDIQPSVGTFDYCKMTHSSELSDRQERLSEREIMYNTMYYIKKIRDGEFYEEFILSNTCGE